MVMSRGSFASPAHRLRSPRGSPRKDAGLSYQAIYGWCSKHASAFLLFLLVLPFAYTSLHWNLLGGTVRPPLPLEWEENRPQNDRTVTTSIATGSQQVIAETYTPDSMHPLPIVYVSGNSAGEERNRDDDTWLNAIQYSKYTVLCETWFYNATRFDLEQSVYSSCSQSNPSPLIVVNWSALQRDCHDLSRILSHVQQKTTTDAVLLMDTTSSVVDVTCDTIGLPAQPTIRLAKATTRNIVDRRWDYDAQWIDTGSFNERYDNSASTSSSPLRLSGVVPEAFVDVLRTIFGDEPPERSVDVSHYWKGSNQDAQQVYNYNRFRRHITEQLESIRGQLQQSKKSGTKKDSSLSSQWVDRVGLLVDEDMESEDPETLLQFHATVLASSKIVIVVQSDEWEDAGSQLWEAMASGSMVLADRMLDPPSDLVHKSNIVWFDDATSLQSNIEYYLTHESKRLEIARKGQQLTLGRHRSWHVLEKVLFGKELTRRDKKPLFQAAPGDRVVRPKSSHTIQLY